MGIISSCMGQRVSWYIEPSQPQRVISGLTTNLGLLAKDCSNCKLTARNAAPHITSCPGLSVRRLLCDWWGSVLTSSTLWPSTTEPVGCCLGSWGMEDERTPQPVSLWWTLNVLFTSSSNTQKPIL